MKNYEKIMKKNRGKDYFFIMYLPKYDFIYIVSVRYVGRGGDLPSHPWEMSWISRDETFINTGVFTRFLPDPYRECLGEI